MNMYGYLPYIYKNLLRMGVAKTDIKSIGRKSKARNTVAGARFDARLSQSQKSIFEEAARIKGFKSLSEFVIQTTLEAATHIIAKNNAILVSEKDHKIFFDALTNSPKPNKALLQAAKDHKTVAASE